MPLQLVHTSVRGNATEDGSALQISWKKTGKKGVVGGAAATSQLYPDDTRKGKNIKENVVKHHIFQLHLPGLHLKVRIVWILIFLLLQKPPSVYTSLMSFPVLVFWGEVRKLPRLMAL